jgi:hypothetical protein
MFQLHFAIIKFSVVSTVITLAKCSRNIWFDVNSKHLKNDGTVFCKSEKNNEHQVGFEVSTAA